MLISITNVNKLRKQQCESVAERRETQSLTETVVLFDIVVFTSKQAINGYIHIFPLPHLSPVYTSMTGGGSSTLGTNAGDSNGTQWRCEHRSQLLCET